MLKQAHQVCKGQNEQIMLSMTVLKIFFTVMKVWPLKMNFRHWNEGQSQISDMNNITCVKMLIHANNMLYNHYIY
jgi:ABC-type transport system involved in cytochrome bd biosynthesis fused ATPase/permease subunit